jgi:hypothetical protein
MPGLATCALSRLSALKTVLDGSNGFPQLTPWQALENRL